MLIHFWMTHVQYTIVMWFLCPPFEEERVYCFAHVGLSVGRPKLVRVIPKQCLYIWSTNFTWALCMTSRWPILILRSTGQCHWPWTWKPCPSDNLTMPWPNVFKLYMGIGYAILKTTIDFEVKCQGHSDLEHEILVWMMTWQCLDPMSSNLTWVLGMTSRCPLFILRSSRQRSRSQWPWTWNFCRSDNLKMTWPTVSKINMGIGKDQ
jgi:hypothetical protein